MLVRRYVLTEGWLVQLSVHYSSAFCVDIASGGAYDWAKSKAGIKYAYTLELRPASGGIYGFVVSPSEIPASGREIWAGLAAAIQRI